MKHKAANNRGTLGSRKEKEPQQQNCAHELLFGHHSVFLALGVFFLFCLFVRDCSLVVQEGAWKGEENMVNFLLVRTCCLFVFSRAERGGKKRFPPLLLLEGGDPLVDEVTEPRLLAVDELIGALDGGLRLESEEPSEVDRGRDEDSVAGDRLDGVLEVGELLVVVAHGWQGQPLAGPLEVLPFLDDGLDRPGRIRPRVDDRLRAVLIASDLAGTERHLTVGQGWTVIDAEDGLFVSKVRSQEKWEGEKKFNKEKTGSPCP